MNIHTLQKVRTFLVVTLLFLMACVGVVYVYSTYIEEPWLSYGNMPFPVTGKVMAGQPVVYPVIRCNSRSTPQTYRTTRNLRRMGAGQISNVLPSIDVTIEPGCNPSVIRMNVVPENTAPGFYMVHGEVPIRGLYGEHTVKWNSGIFEVIANHGTPPVMAINEMRVEVKP